MRICVCVCAHAHTCVACINPLTRIIFSERKYTPKMHINSVFQKGF